MSAPRRSHASDTTVSSADVHPPAGSGAARHPAAERSWTVDLPDQPHHAPNARSGHWRARYDATRAWREAAAWVAKGDRLPQVEGPVVITLTVTPPDRRRRDVDSFALAYKAAVDGLRDAEVLADDSWTHVPEMRIRVAEPDGTKRWRWQLTVTECDQRRTA